MNEVKYIVEISKYIRNLNGQNLPLKIVLYRMLALK